jgi:hypothetical protein
MRSAPLTLAGYFADAEATAREEYLRAVADGSLEGQAYSSWARTEVLLAQGRI